MDSLFASRCPMHPTQTPELKEMQVQRMWVISHQPRPLVGLCSTQTRNQVRSRFISNMCPFTPLPTLKDDHRSLPANPGGGTEMDTGGDFCSLVHKPAETPNYNLDCSPANPTPYEPPTWHPTTAMHIFTPTYILHLRSSLPASKWPVLELTVRRTPFQARQTGT